MCKSFCSVSPLAKLQVLSNANVAKRLCLPVHSFLQQATENRTRVHAHFPIFVDFFFQHQHIFPQPTTKECNTFALYVTSFLTFLKQNRQKNVAERATYRHKIVFIQFCLEVVDFVTLVVVESCLLPTLSHHISPTASPILYGSLTSLVFQKTHRSRCCSFLFQQRTSLYNMSLPPLSIV